MKAWLISEKEKLGLLSLMYVILAGIWLQHIGLGAVLLLLGFWRFSRQSGWFLPCLWIIVGSFASCVQSTFRLRFMVLRPHYVPRAIS